MSATPAPHPLGASTAVRGAELRGEDSSAAPATPLTVKVKRRLLGASSQIGLLNSIRDSRWRQNRLLILCYHSISIDDEHEWSGTYSMSPAQLESRLRMLRDGNYNVLPLGESLRRLYDGTLPPRSVALTFDDGMYDFYARAHPVLESFGFPATVYLTTYYSDYNKPIFGLFCSYVLWRARLRRPEVDAKPLLGHPIRWDLSTEQGRQRAHRDLMHYVTIEGYKLPERIDLAERLTAFLGDDFDALRAKRILTVMTNDEAAEMSRKGVDIQLHTHRHRTPNDHALFLRELVDNRARIDPIRERTASHFCYPSGVYLPEFLPWLEEAGVVSATTCDPGLASRSSAPLLLPRLVDSSFLSPLDVEGWLTGMSAFFMPRKAKQHASPARVATDA
ncbi:MAG TPA: polysaccharide deacetylase family protein [Gemmatimonadaceae bacterium]|jgi:peptidoglycan/xylan/chitin deacetylase (PgdA/CDA1 family)|nr:polysaccharide deacetylase family protein [Gemmatimonadaceae bacterium]